MVSASEDQKASNPLLENLDRTVFTFNMHNLSEMCFNHVFKSKTLQKQSSPSKLPLLRRSAGELT